MFDSHRDCDINSGCGEAHKLHASRVLRERRRGQTGESVERVAALDSVHRNLYQESHVDSGREQVHRPHSGGL